MKVFCSKWTKYDSRGNLCVSVKTDTDKLNIVVYFYRNNLYVRADEIDPKSTKIRETLAIAFTTNGVN